MPLVSAKCTNCGANLEVDNTKDAAICPYCGTPYIVEKAINNYAVTNNIKADVVNIINQGNPNNSADAMYKTCLECCKRGEFEAMGYTLTKFGKEYPTDYRVYYLKLLQYSNNFTYINKEKGVNIHILDQTNSLYNQIKKWAPPNEFNRITNEYNSYISKLKETIQTKQAEEDAERQRIEKEERNNLIFNRVVIGVILIAVIVINIYLLSAALQQFIFAVIVLDVLTFYFVRWLYNNV